jgi:ligand-binding sensor domain-containing protein
VTTRLGGFCLLVANPDPTHRVVERCYSIADGLPHNDVRSITEASDGSMWVGTLLGLSEFAPGAARGRLFHTYTTAHGLSQAQIYKVAEDRDGNLWIGTRTGGVMKTARSGSRKNSETCCPKLGSNTSTTQVWRGGPRVSLAFCVTVSFRLEYNSFIQVSKHRQKHVLAKGKRAKCPPALLRTRAGGPEA